MHTAPGFSMVIRQLVSKHSDNLNTQILNKFLHCWYETMDTYYGNHVRNDVHH